MKMKKWSSQWTQFMQLRKEAWKKGPEKKGPPGGYFLVCAAGWGRIFTTGLTFKELHFYKSY